MIVVVALWKYCSRCFGIVIYVGDRCRRFEVVLGCTGVGNGGVVDVGHVGWATGARSK